MADERDRVARDDSGNLFRLDATTGKWVAATGPDIQVIASGVRGDITAAIEGFIPITGILESFGAVEPGFAAALGNINPTAMAAGQAGGLGLLATGLPSAARFMGGALGLARATTGGVARGVQTGQKVRQISQAADTGPIRVARDVGELVPGAPTGPVAGFGRGIGSILQGAVEQSKILTRVLPGASANLQRQVASNLAGIRGTALKAADFGASGKLPRAALGKAKKATDRLYDEALPAIARNEVVNISKSSKVLLDAIKTAPKSERALIRQILSKKQIEAGKMTNQQLLQRHRELRGLATKTDNQLTREAIDKVTAELEVLMSQSKGINTAKLAEAAEQWRFDQALINSLEESGQLNYSRLISQTKKFFPREFGLADVAGPSARGRVLSQKGQDAINTLVAIQDAGGVTLPSKAVSAVDWILVLTGLSVATGGGLVTAGVF